MTPTYQSTPIQTLRGTAWETNQLCVENGHYQRFMQGLQQFRHQIDSDPHTQYILSTIASHVLNIQTYPGAPSRLQFTYLSDGSMELSQNPQGLKARLEFGQGHIRVTQLFNGQVTGQDILPAHGALLHETCFRVNQFAQQCISECQHACRGHHPHAHPAPQARRPQGSAYGGSGRTRSDPRPIMEATLTSSYAPVPTEHRATREFHEVPYANYGHAKPREFTDLTPEVDALKRDNARLEMLVVEAQRRAKNAELHRDDLKRQLATMEGHHARELMSLRQELEKAHHGMLQAQRDAEEAHASALRKAQAAEDAHRRLRSLEIEMQAITARKRHLEGQLSDAQDRGAQNQDRIGLLTQQLEESHQQANTTQAQMTDLESEVRRLQGKHQQAERDLLLATHHKEKAEREVHTLTQSLKEQSAQHHREMQRLHTQLAHAETKTAESSRRIQELEQELTRTRSSANSSLEQLKARMREAAQKAREKERALKQQLSHTETELRYSTYEKQRLTNELQYKTTALSTTRQQLQELQTEAFTLRGTVQRLESTARQSQARILELQETQRVLTQERERIQKLLAEATDNLSSTHDQTTQVKAEAERLQHTCDGLNHDIQQQALEIQRLTDALRCATAERDALQQKVSTLETEANDLRSKTASQEEKIQHLRRELQATQKEKQRLEVRLKQQTASYETQLEDNHRIIIALRQEKEALNLDNEQLLRTQGRLETDLRTLSQEQDQLRKEVATQDQTIRDLRTKLQEVQPATEEAQRLRVELEKACQDKITAEEEATRLSSRVRELSAQLHEMESRRRAEQDQQQQLLSQQAVRIDTLTQALETAERERIADEAGFTAKILHLQHQHALQVKSLTSQLAATQQTLEGEVALLTQEKLRLLTDQQTATETSLQRMHQAALALCKLKTEKTEVEERLERLQAQVLKLEDERNKRAANRNAGAQTDDYDLKKQLQATEEARRHLVDQAARGAQRIQELERELGAARAAAAAQAVICTVLPPLCATANQACQTGQAYCDAMTTTEEGEPAIFLEPTAPASPRADLLDRTGLPESPPSSARTEADPQPTAREPIPVHIHATELVTDAASTILNGLSGLKMLKSQYEAMLRNQELFAEVHALNTSLYNHHGFPNTTHSSRCPPLLQKAETHTMPPDPHGEYTRFIKTYKSFKSKTLNTSKLKEDILFHIEAHKLQNPQDQIESSPIETLVTQCLERLTPRVCKIIRFATLAHPDFAKRIVTCNIGLINHVIRTYQNWEEARQRSDEAETEKNQLLHKKELLNKDGRRLTETDQKRLDALNTAAIEKLKTEKTAQYKAFLAAKEKQQAVAAQVAELHATHTEAVAFMKDCQERGVNMIHQTPWNGPAVITPSIRGTGVDPHRRKRVACARSPSLPPRATSPERPQTSPR